MPPTCPRAAPPCARAELVAEIQRESAKYIRHALRAPAQALSGRDAAVPAAVQALYAEIDALAQSFHFDHCLHRDLLNKILTDNAAAQ